MIISLINSVLIYFARDLVSNSCVDSILLASSSISYQTLEFPRNSHNLRGNRLGICKKLGGTLNSKQEKGNFLGRNSIDTSNVLTKVQKMRLTFRGGFSLGGVFCSLYSLLTTPLPPLKN